MVLPWHFATIDDWSMVQIGYRVHGITGESLVSTDEGGWHPDWWVFASNYFADPFFIDLRDGGAGFPILFAHHGAGRWDAIRVADSAAQFEGWLRALDGLAAQPQQAAEFVELHMPRNELWAEVATGFREQDEDSDA
jgi:hypothetical protein